MVCYLARGLNIVPKETSSSLWEEQALVYVFTELLTIQWSRNKLSLKRMKVIRLWCGHTLHTELKTDAYTHTHTHRAQDRQTHTEGDRQTDRYRDREIYSHFKKEEKLLFSTIDLDNTRLYEVKQRQNGNYYHHLTYLLYL